MGQEVDLPRQPRGGLVERLLGGRVEEGDGGAGELQTRRQVRGQFVAGQRREVIADDDALGERPAIRRFLSGPFREELSEGLRYYAGANSRARWHPRPEAAVPTRNSIGRSGARESSACRRREP